MSSAIELANVRSDETDAQWAAKVETRSRDVELVIQQYGFAFQQLLDDFYANALSISQSAAIANEQTSNLSSKLGELTIGMDHRLEQMTEMNSQVDDVSGKMKLIHEVTNKTHEAAQTVDKLVGGPLGSILNACARLKGFIEGFGTFVGWFCVVFFVTGLSMVQFVSWFWAVFDATFVAFFLATFFAYVHSPIAYVRVVLAHHPKFFSPVYWSVLAVMIVAIILWEGAKRIFKHLFQSSEADYELRLPVDEYEGMDGKF